MNRINGPRRAPPRGDECACERQQPGDQDGTRSVPLEQVVPAAQHRACDRNLAE
jgi:hypothetical protein